MEVTRELIVPATAARTFGLVDDLGEYPTWLRMVHAATPIDEPVEGATGTEPPAWIVELRGAGRALRPVEAAAHGALGPRTDRTGAVRAGRA